MNAFSDRMMQRKRDGYEVNPMEKYLSTKKPKINDGLLSTESSTSTFLQNNPLDISNSSQISVQVDHFYFIHLSYIPNLSPQRWCFLIENVDHEMLNRCTKVIHRPSIQLMAKYANEPIYPVLVR